MTLIRIICAAILIFSTGKTFSQKSSRFKRADDYVPCDNGWFYFREKCYKVGKQEKLNWERASDRCHSYGGSLVSIESKEENDFILALIMLEVRESLWIGLNDRQKEGEYVWDGGSTSKYRFWRKNEPSGESRPEEDCVQIIISFTERSVGDWNDNDCSRPRAYICQKKMDPEKRSPNPRFCRAELGGGLRYLNSCYHLVTTMKTWEDAEKHCVVNYQGHLITILDTTVDFYIDYLVQNIYTELWIGIKIQDRFQQKWTSGWYVGYDGFGKEHRDFLAGTCAVRSKREKWSVVPCSKKFSFICEVTQNKAPALKPAPKGSYCPQTPEGWRDLDGEFCYYIETKNPANWLEANFECMRRGSQLASIHSKAESDLLHSLFEYIDDQTSAYIGLVRLLESENSFGWTDGTPLDFPNWSPWEPNNDNEFCVEARRIDMKWNDGLCTDKRFYICKTKKISPSVPNVTTSEETDAPHKDAECSGGVSVDVVIGLAVCITLMLILMVFVMYYFRPWRADRRKTSSQTRFQPPTPPTNRRKYTSEREVRGPTHESYYEEMAT